MLFIVTSILHLPILATKDTKCTPELVRQVMTCSFRTQSIDQKHPLKTLLPPVGGALTQKGVQKLALNQLAKMMDWENLSPDRRKALGQYLQKNKKKFQKTLARVNHQTWQRGWSESSRPRASKHAIAKRYQERLKKLKTDPRFTVPSCMKPELKKISCRRTKLAFLTDKGQIIPHGINSIDEAAKKAHKIFDMANTPTEKLPLSVQKINAKGASKIFDHISSQLAKGELPDKQTLASLSRDAYIDGLDKSHLPPRNTIAGTKYLTHAQARDLVRDPEKFFGKKGNYSELVKSVKSDLDYDLKTYESQKRFYGQSIRKKPLETFGRFMRQAYGNSKAGSIMQFLFLRSFLLGTLAPTLELSSDTRFDPESCRDLKDDHENADIIEGVRVRDLIGVTCQSSCKLDTCADNIQTPAMDNPFLIALAQDLDSENSKKVLSHPRVCRYLQNYKHKACNGGRIIGKATSTCEHFGGGEFLPGVRIHDQWPIKLGLVIGSGPFWDKLTILKPQTHKITFPAVNYIYPKLGSDGQLTSASTHVRPIERKKPNVGFRVVFTKGVPKYQFFRENWKDATAINLPKEYKASMDRFKKDMAPLIVNNPKKIAGLVRNLSCNGKTLKTKKGRH